MYILFVLFSLQQILAADPGSQEALAYGRVCPIRPLHRKIVCDSNYFQCLNGQCLTRLYHCDHPKGYHCADFSDQEYCNTTVCPELFTKCKTSNKCIPNEWVCDGIKDCPSKEDENKCDIFETYSKTVQALGTATTLSLKFLHQSKQESAIEKWGPLADKIAVALYLLDDSFVTENETRKEVAYEVSIQLLSRLLRSKLEDISSTDLASFVNAFLVSCIDARKFYGVDIVQELRTRVDQQSYTNPYVLLSLCNAGETISESDKLKLIDTFWNKRRPFWTDMQAVSVMALACASKQPGSLVDMNTLRELTMELKHQYRNGTVENLQTTALIMQALLSVEPDADPNNFDEIRALGQIFENQNADGSFGNLINTYFILPVLNCKSLVDISTDHCKTADKDVTQTKLDIPGVRVAVYRSGFYYCKVKQVSMEDSHRTAIQYIRENKDQASCKKMTELEDLTKRGGPKIRVEYLLWIGDEKHLEGNLALGVPENLSLYGVMEVAAEIDSRYKFEYVVKDGKPYVNAISDIQDNPERGKFWFLYVIKDGEPSLVKESPADLIPKNNDTFIMWYRSGPWIE